MNNYIMVCKECESQIEQVYQPCTDEFYLYCPLCKIHETILRYDDHNKFYKVKLEKLKELE